MKTLIYQIGRTMGDAKSFFFEEFCHESELSSFFLKEYLSTKQQEAKVVLIYPVSILLNKKLLEELEKRNLDDFKQEIMNIIKDPSEYLKSPDFYIRKIPCEKDKDDILLVHSLGTYLGIELKSHYDDIVLELFFDMVKRYLHEQIQTFYLDISSGLNIYISAMIEAAKYFSTFFTLMNWSEENIPEIFITFSDPIIGNTASKYEIHLQKQVYPRIFTSPLSSYFKRTRHGVTLTESELNKFLKDEIFSNDSKELIKQLKSSLSKKLLKSFLIYSAIVNCVPLYLYYSDKHTEQEIFQEIEKFIDYAAKKLYFNFTESPRLNKEVYIEIICQLALYVGMIKMLQKHNIELVNPESGISLKNLRSIFKKILIQAGLSHSLMFLKNEADNTIKKINKYFKKYMDQIEKWVGMYEVMESRKSTLNERNFFAHIGLEANITEVKKDAGEEIYARYIGCLPLNELSNYLLKNI